MGTIHLVFGPQGAGKSTYARELASRTAGLRFSIDEWMGSLYGADLPKPLDVAWITERVQRCEQRIWATAAEVARSGTDIVLDLGFMKAASRSAFISRGWNANHAVQLHHVTAPQPIRRERVLARNEERGETFSFEVTPSMFDFMETQFEPPTAEELSHALLVESHRSFA
ncbi:MAG: ATP-binding protein [Polaromonas sp.]|nr:ATP-binding protein [Polaromonas sp.]